MGSHSNFSMNLGKAILSYLSRIICRDDRILLVQENHMVIMRLRLCSYNEENNGNQKINGKITAKTV